MIYNLIFFSGIALYTVFWMLEIVFLSTAKKRDGKALTGFPLITAAGASVFTLLTAVMQGYGVLRCFFRSLVILRIAGLLLCTAGIAVLILDNAEKIRTREEGLIVSGIYSLSRTPFALSFLLFSAGFVAVFWHPVLFALTVLAVIFIHLYTVNVTEDGLLEKYGEQYTEYKFSVNRYFGKTKYNKTVGRIIICLISLGAAGVIAVMIINCIVLNKTKNYILPEEEAAKLTDVDCVLVLGCGVKSDGTPSDMLHDRVQVGIRVFDTGVTDRILMSGDHGRKNYDEVNAMKKMATDSGIDPDEVFLDHAGFSTYESMYRAKEIFCVKKMIIVTQEYHLSRAIFIARALGIEAYGVSADERNYRNQTYRELREAVARVKDVFYCIVKPKPTYLGEKIPITEKGSRTDG